MTNPNLTVAMKQHILSSIRAGAYPHVAAEAWGVPAHTFGDWLGQAKTDGAEVSFAAEVRQAHATARAVAETKLFASDPKFWLEHGPGRETAESPGWTVKAAELSPPAEESHWLQPTFLQFIAAMLTELSSFPEARHRAAQALTRAGVAVPALAAA